MEESKKKPRKKKVEPIKPTEDAYGEMVDRISVRIDKLTEQLNNLPKKLSWRERRKR